MTLIEIVLASAIAVVFLTAFLVQFRVQQSSFQAASDELRLPSLGWAAANRMLGQEGLAPMYRPDQLVTLQAAALVRPGQVRMPMGGRRGAGTDYRDVRFVESTTDPRPAGMRPGMIVQSENGIDTPLTPPDLVATVSFYSPELFAGTSNCDLATVSAAVQSGGTDVLYVLGAALGQFDTPGPKSLYMDHTSGTDEWVFWFNGSKFQTSPRRFSPAGTFVLDGQYAGAGILTCVWPRSQYLPALGNFAVGYDLRDRRQTRRVGFWLQLNTSPHAGVIAIRDSLFLRN